MVDISQIARGLQGFGAGVAGQGGQFLAGLQQQEQQLDDNRKQALLEDAFTARQHLLNGNAEAAMGLFSNRLNNIAELGGDPADTLAVAQMVQSGDIQGAVNELSIPIDMAIGQGLFKAPAGQAKPAEQASFEALIADFTDEEKVIAKRIKAGLDARAVGSAGQTITALGTAEDVAATEATLSEGKESGKQSAQLAYKPQIAKAVSLAQSKASARGETLTTVARAKAAMPGLQEAVKSLKALAPLATSTFGGRVWDAAIKETGFGSTKGADARTGFIAIINNQVLPLLKQTFGAAFTEREGETLKATMGDPNATPAEKMIQLDAFIAQKTRDIEAGEIELAAGQSLPQGVTEDDITTTMNANNMTREQVMAKLGGG